MSSSERQIQIESTLVRSQTKHSVPTDAPISVQQATRYIHDQLFNPTLTVKRLRDQLGMTDAMFSARFRRHHGQTPACYIRHLRVAAARRLLVEYPDLRTADVALHVGYEHYRTFARVFKRITGRSPQAFREQEVGC